MKIYSKHMNKLKVLILALAHVLHMILYCWEFKFSLFIICILFVVFMEVILDKSGSGCCLLGSCNFCLFFSGCF